MQAEEILAFSQLIIGKIASWPVVPASFDKRSGSGQPPDG
jgi:hypothetical protein